MTTSRIVRGTKGRIFLYVCAVLVFTGLIACYNSARVEVEKVQKTNELCQQEQENLATQLQMISDYKQRLEKSLKTEKAEHQQTKAELESRVNEERLRGEKTTGEATIRFNSLQQQYNILKTDYNDLKEKCSKSHNKQLDEINNLQSKLNKVQEQLKLIETEKENSIEHLKSLIEQLNNEKLNLERQVKGNNDKEEIIRLQKELDTYKNQNKETQTSGLKGPEFVHHQKSNFSNLINIDGDYKVANEKSNINNVVDIPALSMNDTNVDDNVDNNQNAQLPIPNNNNLGIKSSTANTIIKQSSKASMNIAAPLKLPTVTPETTRNKTSEHRSNMLPLPSPNRKLPDGVVPPQVLPEPVHIERSSKASADNVADLVNNRYRNVADDQENKFENPEKDNGANKVMDFPAEDEDNDTGKDGNRKVEKNNYDDYDKLQQNDVNLEENEDDDADEYGNHQMHKDTAIRN